MARRWSLTCSCVLASSPSAAAAVGGSGIPAGAERKTAHRKVAVNSNKARGKPGRPAVRSKPIWFPIPAFRPMMGESLAELWGKSDDFGKGTNHVGAGTNPIVERWIHHHPRGWGGRYVDRTKESRRSPKDKHPPSRSADGPPRRLVISRRHPGR